MDAVPANTLRMLISKQRLHEILGEVVLRSHGLSGDLPVAIEFLTILNREGQIDQLRVEVEILPDDNHPCEDED